MTAFDLLRNRNFMLVWTSGFISWTGNYTLFVALPIYIYAETGSTLATGIGVMATALPTLVVGQVAGVLVDRWSYTRTMVLTNVALVSVTLAFLSVLHAPWWAVVPVALAQSSVGQFLGPAENALLPTLVGESRLGAANSLNALNNNLARLIGPALGGVLIASTGFVGVVLFNALTYLVAALLVLGVNAPRVERGVSRETNPYRRLLFEWLAGLRAVSANRSLRLCFLVAGFVGFGEGFVSTLIAPFVAVILGGGGPELGAIFSAQALGGIVAGLLLTSFVDRLPVMKLLRWSSLLTGLVLCFFFFYPLFYPQLWLGLVLTALVGLPAAGWGTAQMTLVQTQAEPQKRGRVFSTYLAVFGAAQLVGMGVSGVLGEAVGVMVIAVDALMYLLAGVVLVVSRIREGGRDSG